MINLDPKNPNGGSFFDSRTILATLIIIASFGGWYYYISKKYPSTPTPQQVQVEKQVEKRAETIPEEKPKTLPAAEKSDKTEHIDQALRFDGETMSFDITNRGMGVQNITLKKFTERDGSRVELAKNLQTHFLNETSVDDKDLYFLIQKKSDTEYVGTAKAGNIEVKKTISIDPAKYLVNSELEFSKTPQSVEIFLAGDVNRDQSSSLLKRNYDKESVFVTYGTNETARKDVDPKTDKILDQEYSAVSIAAIDKHYFTLALVDRSEVMPSFSAHYDQQASETIGALKYTTTGGAAPKLLSQLYVGPKKIKLLSLVDERLTKTINFKSMGMDFSWLARPILSLLKFFYSLFGNYGIAIILVTFLIRLLLMPINLSSYKSMKKMQTIQPELKLLKERYKNEPQRLQVETMNVMKQNKVNPLGGCLPMLLQFPIFIALYDVLAQSIELYQAPFVFWIRDLSLKDPYYVLPILMGITMYIQQKITPSAMDPAQAKAMQFMPVLFAGLMISLPSGLTLYIFVSTLFGILQQYIMMKEKNEPKTVQVVSK